jgi:apolipoprotein N-acyltransferase
MSRKLNESPDLFVGCANEAAFTGPLYAHISLDAQRLRAIECRRAFARVAQDGISAFVDGNGDVLRAEWTEGDADVLVCRVPIDRRSSFYAAWGDWLPISSCVVLAVLIISAVVRRTPVSDGVV